MKGKPLIEVLTHGGKRPNAGRKPGTPRNAVTVRLSEPARKTLAELKRDTGKSYGTILEQLLQATP